MNRAKKDRPKTGTFEQSCPGLAPRTNRMIIISNSRQNASPNLDGGGGASPMSGWVLALTMIGSGSLESEYAVLGSLLIVGAEENKAGIRAILSAVREEDFQYPPNRELYQAARNLFRAGKPVDGVTLRECCGGKYGDYLLQLMEITPTAANWREYAEIMREKAVLRQAADLGRSLAASQTLEDCRRDHAHLGQLLSDGRKLDSWGMPELLESFFQSQDPEAPKNVSDLDTSGGAQQIEYIDIGLLDGDPRNRRDLRGLEELAANIELLGLRQPLRVRENPESPGRFIIVSGHRRRAALQRLVDDGRADFARVPCIRDVSAQSSALQELRLIFDNLDTQPYSSAEKAKIAARVEELLYVLKEEGMEFPGRMRDQVAAACRISAPKLARLKVIQR